MKLSMLDADVAGIPLGSFSNMQRRKLASTADNSKDFEKSLTWNLMVNLSGCTYFQEQFGIIEVSLIQILVGPNITVIIFTFPFLSSAMLD